MIQFFKISLTFQMAVATILGILFGLFLGDLCDVFTPWTTAYIMLLKITAVPYLIVAIIQGLGQLSSSQAKQILQKGLIFISLAWSINIAMIYATKFAFPQAASSSPTGYASIDSSHLNFAELLIPDNIFYDLSNNIVPAIVIFSVLIGIALMRLKDKAAIMLSFSSFVEALTRITGWIARITPIGTFLIIANQAGTIELSTVKQVSTYIILYIFTAILIIFWIFPRLTQMLTAIPSYRWVRELLPVLLLAYTTNVVIVCLPYIIELLKKETLILDPLDEKAQNQIQGTVSIVFNLPLGSLFITVFVFFISLFYNAPLSLGSQFELFITSFLTSLGAVGLGSWINSLTFILDSLGLPANAVSIFLTTLPFTSGFQSMISVIEIASVSLLITLACRGSLVLQWRKIIRHGLFTFIPVCFIFAGVKVFDFLPHIYNEIKSIYELQIRSPVSVTVLSSQAKASKQEGPSFERILKTKHLRVGYIPTTPPFCFLNKEGALVGYDVALAHELAFDLGCSLEFVPMHYQNISEELNSGLYDIAMSAVTMNEERLKTLSFTLPYLKPRFVFVTSDQGKKYFQSLKRIHDGQTLKIAVLQGSSFETLARDLFPEKDLILLSSYAEFIKYPGKVALLWEEEEAAAWTLLHRDYRIVLPTPGFGRDFLSYPIAGNDLRFQNYLNQWMSLKENQGFLSKQYDLWVKGKTEIAAPTQQRWSIIRNVLHWVD